MQKLSFVTRYYLSFFLIAALLVAVAGCNKKAESVTPALPGNEFLTTVQLQLTNTADPTDVQLCSWTQFSPFSHTYQPDSAYFSRAVLNLRANATYSGRVIILDETQTPVDTVSDEIQQRMNYHLFFFQPTPILSSNIVVSNTTTDIPGGRLEYRRARDRHYLWRHLHQRNAGHLGRYPQPGGNPYGYG
jgi:hypothetical protein